MVDSAVTDLFADAAPGVVEDGVLVPGYRGVQLLQHDLNAAAAVDEAPDVVHHGGLTEHAGTLVGGPGGADGRMDGAREPLQLQACIASLSL